MVKEGLVKIILNTHSTGRAIDMERNNPKPQSIRFM